MKVIIVMSAYAVVMGKMNLRRDSNLRIPILDGIRIFEAQSQSQSNRNPNRIATESQSQLNAIKSQSQSNRNQISIAKETFKDSNPTNGIRSDRIFLGIESLNLPNPESSNTTLQAFEMY